MSATNPWDLKRKKKLGMAGIGFWVLAMVSAIAYFYFKERSEDKVPRSSKNKDQSGNQGQQVVTDK
jgi:hypothetical protein